MSIRKADENMDRLKGKMLAKAEEMLCAWDVISKWRGFLHSSVSILGPESEEDWSQVIHPDLGPKTQTLVSCYAHFFGCFGGHHWACVHVHMEIRAPLLTSPSITLYPLSVRDRVFYWTQSLVRKLQTPSWCCLPSIGITGVCLSATVRGFWEPNSGP